MNRENLDKNISLIAWLLGLTIFIVLSIFLVFDEELKGMTDEEPIYSLLIMFIPISIFQFINYKLVGKYRLQLGVSNNYMFNKLFLHPGLWLGILLAMLVGRVFGS